MTNCRRKQDWYHGGLRSLSPSCLALPTTPCASIHVRILISVYNIHVGRIPRGHIRICVSVCVQHPPLGYIWYSFLTFFAFLFFPFNFLLSLSERCIFGILLLSLFWSMSKVVIFWLRLLEGCWKRFSKFELQDLLMWYLEMQNRLFIITRTMYTCLI